MEGIIFDFLKSRVTLFQYFTDNQIRTIIEESKLLFCEENEAVARFGEETLFLGVVIEGELSASAIGEGGIRKEIRKFITGDTFGEISIIRQSANQATLKERRVVHWKAPKEAFKLRKA